MVEQQVNGGGERKGKIMLVLAVVFAVGAIAMGGMAFNYYSMASEANANYERNYQKSVDAYSAGNTADQTQYASFSEEDINSYHANNTTAMTYGGGAIFSLLVAGGLFWKRKK